MLTANPFPLKMDLTGSASFYSAPLYSSMSHSSQHSDSDPQETISGESLSAIKETREKRPHTSPSVKRANTSPVIRSAADTDPSSAAALADSKKRNKLGYHRTAVACGHCRRRKIRCIPSPDGSSSRCQNCVRLKKECHFFPVDQTAPSARKGRSDSKAEASSNEPDVSVGSSSPGAQVGSGTDPYDSTPGTKRSPVHKPMLQTGGPVMHDGSDFEASQPFEQKWDVSAPGSTPTIMFGPDQGYMGMQQHSGYWSANEHMTPGGFATSPFAMQQSPETQVQQSEMHFTYPPRATGDATFGMARQSVDMPVSSAEMPGNFQNLYRANTYPDMDRRLSTPETFHQQQNAYPAGLNISMSPEYGYGSMTYQPWMQQMAASNQTDPHFAMNPHDQAFATHANQQQEPMPPRYLPSQRPAQRKFKPNPG